MQRTVDYSSFNGNKTEQLTNTDFDEGWIVFVDVIKILKPTDCVFIGVTAAISFERMMDSLNIQRTERFYQDKINSAKPATTSVAVDGLKHIFLSSSILRLIFRQICGNLFWRNIIQK